MANEANVLWTQRTPITPIAFGSYSIDSYTGSTLIADWPKAAANLGGGWTVGASRAVDTYLVALGGGSHQFQLSWSSKKEEHETGDPLPGDGYARAVDVKAEPIEPEIRGSDNYFNSRIENDRGAAAA